MRLGVSTIVFGAMLSACAGTEPAQSDEPITSESVLMLWLGDRNYVVERIGFTSFRAEGVRGNAFDVSGYGSGRLNVWTFGNEATAARALIEIRGWESSQVSPNQLSLYRSGPLVVAYTGTDAGLRADLASVLGRQR